MPRFAICPECHKTIVYDDEKSVCPECGQLIPLAKIKQNNGIIDAETERIEFEAGKDYFKATEFGSAAEHFKRALEANGNSYLSLYFYKLCEIYTNEEYDSYDVMTNAVLAVKDPLQTMIYAGISAADRLRAITAILNEVKIIIVNKLNSLSNIYEEDTVGYRKKAISELQVLLKLFEIDSEVIMTFSPDVRKVLLEIADTSLAVCHMASQSAVVDNKLYYPTDEEYGELLALNNSYCFFAQSFMPEYDIKKYTPDFSQNAQLNKKVKKQLEEFDKKNDQHGKKFVIKKIDEYDKILLECKRAIEYCDKNCFKSLCDSAYPERVNLLKDGASFILRVLTPCFIAVDKKTLEFRVEKFFEISEQCALLTKFLTDKAFPKSFGHDLLCKFYAELLHIIDFYCVPEFEKQSKSVNKIKDAGGKKLNVYERFLYKLVCATAPALKEYINYGDGSDRSRLKLVKYCKRVSEEFLMLLDYRIDEIDQSNVFRPILDIYNVVMKETGG